MGNYHLVHVACIFAFFAYQIHILTMTSAKYRLGIPKGNSDRSQDDVVQAFIIIAYALFIIGLIMSVMMTRTKLANSNTNVCSVITAIILFLAAGSVVVGLAVYNNYYTKATLLIENSHHITTFTTGGACGFVGAVLLLLALCC